MSEFYNRYGQWALITGASRGIGAALARELAKKRINLILVARDEKQLQSLSATLHQQYSVQIKVIVLDLLEENAVETLYQQCKDKNIGLVIPNAGIETNGPFVDSSMKDNNDLIKLNIQIPMQMVNLFAKDFRDKKRGGFLLLSSLFAYQGVPMVANYSASKAYILSLGEALNVEFSSFNVDVTVVSPGLTDTDMPKNMPINFKKMPVTISSPEKVAKVALNSLGKKATVVPGFINKFYAWQNRLVPRTFPVKLFGFLLKRAYKK